MKLSIYYYLILYAGPKYALFAHQIYLFLQKSVYPLMSKVLVLIGTNDVLAGRKLPWMIEDMDKLIAILRARKVAHITILTLPPIPRLSITRAHWEVSDFPNGVLFLTHYLY